MALVCVLPFTCMIRTFLSQNSQFEPRDATRTWHLCTVTAVLQCNKHQKAQLLYKQRMIEAETPSRSVVDLRRRAARGAQRSHRVDIFWDGELCLVGLRRWERNSAISKFEEQQEFARNDRDIPSVQFVDDDDGSPCLNPALTTARDGSH